MAGFYTNIPGEHTSDWGPAESPVESGAASASAGIWSGATASQLAMTIKHLLALTAGIFFAVP
jgi:hypothetical protein